MGRLDKVGEWVGGWVGLYIPAALLWLPPPPSGGGEFLLPSFLGGFDSGGWVGGWVLYVPGPLWLPPPPF